MGYNDSMSLKQLEQWTQKFMKSWKDRDPDRVMSLFDTSKLTYFESAVKPPMTNWNKVYDLWKVVPNNQKDIKISSDIVVSNNSFGVVHWTLSRFFIPTSTYQHIDGIFIISLNKKGLCTYFNQWRSVA